MSMFNFLHFSVILSYTFNLLNVLLIVIIIFAILIIFAVIRSIKLNAETKRLAEESNKKSQKKAYQDFTEGHLYENKK